MACMSNNGPLLGKKTTHTHTRILRWGESPSHLWQFCTACKSVIYVKYGVGFARACQASTAAKKVCHRSTFWNIPGCRTTGYKLYNYRDYSASLFFFFTLLHFSRVDNNITFVQFCCKKLEIR